MPYDYPDPAQQWTYTDWQMVNRDVFEMQRDIAQASLSGTRMNILSAQEILTRSYPARLLAVRLVTSSKGARTAGVDHEHWTTPQQKMKAVFRLNQGLYQAKPARRIHIPKPGLSTKRPISILTMYDRAMQALYGLALRPVSETTGDPHSYGYRLNRSAPEAIRYLTEGLAHPHALPWILKADIHECFDSISHEWLIKHIPINRDILIQFLSCGYVERWQFSHSEEGVMQGGYISPILANMALDGMESLLHSQYKENEFRFVRYADDFVVAAATKKTAGDMYDLLSEFVAERGLHFSKSKTDIIHLSKGFEYLGMSLRSSVHHLTVRPAYSSVQAILSSIQEIIDKGTLWEQEKLIKTLNPMILGWVRYHQFLPTSALDIRMNAAIRMMLRKWAERRHPKQPTDWVEKEYWHQNHHQEPVFSAGSSALASFTADRVKIKTHARSKNPFLDDDRDRKPGYDLSERERYGYHRPYLSSSPYPPAHWLNTRDN